MRSLKGEAGQAALEMALAMPLFVAVVVGMIQSALVLQTYCNATYACRNAARFASLNSPTSLAATNAGAAAAPTYGSTQAKAMVKAGLFLNASITPSVTVTYLDPTTLTTSTNAVGNLVCVRASWSQSMSIPFMATSGFTVGTQSCKMVSR